MAVAGINNVSVLESMGWGNQDRSITRTSLIRKLWQDLEDENRNREVERQHTSGKSNVNLRSQCSCSSERAESENISVSTNEAENECPRDTNQMVIQNIQEDNENLCSQRSPAISVPDKESVKQVFREWGSKNISGRALNVSGKNNFSRAQSVCEDEGHRVRTVRQWIESSSQQAETGDSVKEEQASEVGCQVKRVQEGSPKSIRRLYGRQALVETLTRFEMEREKEMKKLMESRWVSNFAHKNRIQALFRGRFLCNQRFVQDEKPSSTTTSELGILRQTNTVSDLRKGFLSISDSDEQSHEGSQSDMSSDNDIKDRPENFQQLPDDIHSEFQMISIRSNVGTITRGIPMEYDAPVEEKHDQVLEKGGEKQLSPIEIIEIRNQDSLLVRKHCAHPIELSQETMELESPSHSQYQSNYEELEVNEAFGHFNHSETNTEILFNVDELDVNEEFDHFSQSETKTEIMSNGEELEVNDSEINTEILSVNEAFDLLNHSETNTEILSNGYTLEDNEEFHHLNHSETNTEIFTWQECSVQEVECQEPSGSEWHHLINTESNEGLDANSIGNEEDEWYQETNGFDFQESHDAFYTFDGENGTRLELRQLTNRRRVSNLLQSGFRVRLDQLIQSYVENHHHSSESDNDWMLNQQSVDENYDVTESVEMIEADITGTDWEIINGMRLDMVMLQERMNNMQRTLETCIKMQLELQHSVQQEVSSALNRSSTSGEDCLQTCSLCFDFDSSPDRCGHVYVCSNCAEKINWSKLKESVRHPVS